MPKHLDSLHRRPKEEPAKKEGEEKKGEIKINKPDPKPADHEKNKEQVDKVGDFFLVKKKREAETEVEEEIEEEKPKQEHENIPISTKNKADEFEPQRVTSHGKNQPNILSIDRTETFVTYVLLIIGIIIIILGVGVIMLFRTQPAADSKSTEVKTERPTETATTTTPETKPAEGTKPAETTPTPTAVNKATTKLSILNGNGRTGEASTAKATLTGKGWTVASVGNAANIHPQTTIYYHSGKSAEADALKGDFGNSGAQTAESNEIVGSSDLVLVLGQT